MHQLGVTEARSVVANPHTFEMVHLFFGTITATKAGMT